VNGAALTARSAFAGVFASPAGRGLLATERDGLGIASLSVRHGQRAALERRVTAHFGVALPDHAGRVCVAGIAAAGTGPASWLVTSEQAGNAFGGALKAAVGESASVTDQSDAYAIIRLAGPELRETLAKLVPIDLHARAFGVGAVAGTLLGHINALLWRLEDGADGQPVFEVAVYRSMAASLWQELLHHAADLSDDYS
jgi:methylglutamate dehydrogenase subunit D